VNRRSVSRSAVLCLSMMIAGALAVPAQQVQPLEPEWLRQMYEQGWQKVQEGVLQRDTGGGQYETFGYGAEGLQWILQGYEQQVSRLEEKHGQSPNVQLAMVIVQLEGEIAQLNETLLEAPSAGNFDSEALETCTPSFGGSAFAGPQYEAQGAEATASAYFHSDCGQLADTFATAYAHAIAGSVETTKVQSDQRNGGAWLDSQATAGASGSTGCESSAQASVTSSELSISYQTPFKQSYSCLRPPLQIDPSKITLDGAGSDGIPGRLADEQALARHPRAGDRVDVISNWKSNSGVHVNAAIIDLGAVYRIGRIYLYDRNGEVGGTIGSFTVTAGSAASGWTTTLINEELKGYLTWKGFPNDPANDPTTDGSYTNDDPALEFSNVTARYLRVVNPNGQVVMPEIVVYGTLVSP
jgi:hypothetical protein